MFENMVYSSILFGLLEILIDFCAKNLSILTMLLYNKAEQLFINRDTNSTVKKLFFSPITRVLIAILFLVPIIILNNIFMDNVLVKVDGYLRISLQISKAIILISLLIYSYSWYTKLIEKRPAFEFDFNLWKTEFGIGALIGGGMILFLVFILFVAGSFKIESINSPLILLIRFFRYGQGSFIEDLLFTIIIYRLLEEYFGTIISYLFVTLLFGGLHILNNGALIADTLFISIQQITLLAPFILTRRIWMVWAVHFSWNYFQSGIFGMNNSGMDHDGFITPLLSGPDWLTGGSFGIEGSWLSLIVNLVVGVTILVYAIRAKQFVKAKWNRNSEQPDIPWKNKVNVLRYVSLDWFMKKYNF